MFWDQFHEKSELDKLLESNDFTLENLADQESFVDACRSGNSQLIEFLCQPDQIAKLVGLALDGDLSSEQSAKRSVTCSNTICADSSISSYLLGQPEVVERIFSRLSKDQSQLSSSNTCRMITDLMSDHCEAMITWCERCNFTTSVLALPEVDFVGEMMVALLENDHSSEHEGLLKYFETERLVPRLLDVLASHPSEEALYNAVSVCCMVLDKRLSNGINPLIAQLLGAESAAIIAQAAVSENDARSEEALRLILHVFNTTGKETASSLPTAELEGAVASVIPSLAKRLSPGQSVGVARTRAVHLLATLAQRDNATVHDALGQSDAVTQTVQLMFSFPKASIMHAHGTEFLTAVLSRDGARAQAVALGPARLLSRIVEAMADPAFRDIRGHLLELITTVHHSLSKSPTVSVATKECSGWTEMVEGIYKELVTRADAVTTDPTVGADTFGGFDSHVKAVPTEAKLGTIQATSSFTMAQESNTLGDSDEDQVNVGSEEDEDVFNPRAAPAPSSTISFPAFAAQADPTLPLQQAEFAPQFDANFEDSFEDFNPRAMGK